MRWAELPVVAPKVKIGRFLPTAGGGITFIVGQSGAVLSMAHEVTRITIRRPDGRTEIIGRKTLIDPHQATRDLARHGTVLSVRHERIMPEGGRETIAIHQVGR